MVVLVVVVLVVVVVVVVVVVRTGVSRWFHSTVSSPHSYDSTPSPPSAGSSSGRGAWFAPSTAHGSGAQRSGSSQPWNVLWPRTFQNSTWEESCGAAIPRSTACSSSTRLCGEGPPSTNGGLRESTEPHDQSLTMW